MLCLLLSALAEAGVPAITNQRVTDIATRSFSVIGTVSEPSALTFSLYSSDCATPATGYSSSLQQNAASGNMRLTVTGLTAATSYCYSLSIASTSTSQQTTSAPSTVATAAAVARTKSSGSNIVPTGNDILRSLDIFLPTSETRDGTIVTLELPDGSAVSPLSLLLSDDADADYFNLNNLFATATGTSLDLVGGERMKITEIHGTSGCTIERYRTIPADAGLTAARPFLRPLPNDIDASGGVNILDVLRVAGGKGTTSTGTCFNSDLNLNGNGTIGITDLTIVKGGFNGQP